MPPRPLPADAPSLTDLVDPTAPLRVTVHSGFDFWLEDPEAADEATRSTPRAGERGRGAHRTPGGRRGCLLDAAGGAATGALGAPGGRGRRSSTRWPACRSNGGLELGEATRFLGSFRASGLVVPVWDLPAGTEVDEVEDAAAAFRSRLDAALAAPEPLTGRSGGPGSRSGHDSSPSTELCAPWRPPQREGRRRSIVDGHWDTHGQKGIEGCAEPPFARRVDRGPNVAVSPVGGVRTFNLSQNRSVTTRSVQTREPRASGDQGPPSSLGQRPERKQRQQHPGDPPHRRERHPRDQPASGQSGHPGDQVKASQAPSQTSTGASYRADRPAVVSWDRSPHSAAKSTRNDTVNALPCPERTTDSTASRSSSSSSASGRPRRPRGT